MNKEFVRFVRLGVMLGLIIYQQNAHADTPALAYVSNQNGNVTIVDLNTMEEKGLVVIAAKGPRGIGITGDGKTLVTANKEGGNISIVDLTNRTPLRLVKIGKNPEFVRVIGQLAYITYEPSSTSGPPKTNSEKEDDDEEEKIPGHIAIVDLISGKILKDITGKPETEGLEFTADGKKLLVTNESDNSITIHDAAIGKLLKTVSVAKYGERPRGIKVSPDGKTYVVTLELSDKFLVLNKKFEVIKEVATGKTPYGISYDQSGDHIFVAANKEKALQVFDAKTYSKIKDIPTGDRCWHFTFTPDNKNLLLACGKSDEIIVINAESLSETKRIKTKDMPWGIVTSPKSFGSLDRP